MKVKVLSVSVQNSMGILARITSLFSGKGYSLKSLTAGTSPERDKSRVTIVCNSSETEYNQVKKQLNKMIEVVKVKDLSGLEALRKELAFIKMRVPSNKRTNVITIAESLEAKIQDVCKDEIVFELVCASEKIDHFLTVFSEYQVLSVARSGLVAMELTR